jgi:hypothetical protein
VFFDIDSKMNFRTLILTFFLKMRGTSTADYMVSNLTLEITAAKVIMPMKAELSVHTRVSRHDRNLPHLGAFLSFDFLSFALL